MAAFSTERWSRHAMMARQSRRPRPKAPRIAPTQMKTVPCGTFDVRMYGALSVGGTVGAGYVGMAVSAAEVEVVLRVGMSEPALSVALRLGISLDATVVAAVLSPAFADVAPSVGIASVAVASSVAANTPAVKSDKEKTADRSSDCFRESRDLLILA